MLAFADADLIHSYTRAEALEDGALVDASTLAREAGFTVPVAFTCAAWGEAVACRGVVGQDEKGRLWDVLSVLRMAARRGGSIVRFQVLVSRVLVNLKAHIGPGDSGEPVVTIMLPQED